MMQACDFAPPRRGSRLWLPKDEGALAMPPIGLGPMLVPPKAATSSFTPTSPTSASCKLWLRGDSATTGATFTWADKTTNGNNYTQPTSASQPTLGTAINSKPTVTFSNGTSNKYVSKSGSWSLTAAHVFVVGKLIADPTTGTIYGFWRFGTGGAECAVPFTDGIIYDDFGSSTRRTTSNPTPSMTSPFLYEVVSTSSEWTNKLNGTQLFTTATNTVSWDLSGSSIGGSSGTGYLGLTAWLGGDLGEVILYNGKLSTSDRSSLVSSYINGYWGTSFT